MNDTSIAGAVAIVTGGSRGIGLAIADVLAQDGAVVAIVGRNGERAKEVASGLTGDGHAGYACDVGDAEQVNAVVKSITDDLGPPAILVNNAGITRDNLLVLMKDDDFDEVIASNLKGPFNFTRAVTRGMMKRRNGVILNITSVVGLTGNAGQANYAASKAGLVGLTKSVAKELASRGVRCNALAPGFIRTDMTDALTDEQVDGLLERIPLGTLADPSDVAQAARFLVSPAARYITGQVLAVDGGMVM